MKRLTLSLFFIPLFLTPLTCQEIEFNKYNIITRLGFRSLFETSLGFELFTEKENSFELSLGYNYAFLKNEGTMCGLQAPSGLFNTSYRGPRVSFGWSKHLSWHKYINVNLFYSQRTGHFDRDTGGGCGTFPQIRFDEKIQDYGFVLYFVRNRSPEKQVKFYWGLGGGFRDRTSTGATGEMEENDTLFLHVDIGAKFFLRPLVVKGG